MLVEQQMPLPRFPLQGLMMYPQLRLPLHLTHQLVHHPAYLLARHLVHRLAIPLTLLLVLYLMFRLMMTHQREHYLTHWTRPTLITIPHTGLSCPGTTMHTTAGMIIPQESITTP